MRYIVSAESKSLLNYGNRTEKIIPADATMDISRGWKSEKSGLGFLAVWAWVWDSRNKGPVAGRNSDIRNETPEPL